MTKQEEYNYLFEYYDGILWWKNPTHPIVKVGQRAGTIVGSKKNYLRVKANGVYVYNHIAIWIMHNGDIPDNMEVAHEDKNPLNNDIANLRITTRTQNALNKRYRNEDTGIYFCEKRKKWKAQISRNNKNWNLGRFDTKGEAREAYKQAYITLHGDFK